MSGDADSVIRLVRFNGSTYVAIEDAYEAGPLGFSDLDRAAIIAAAHVLTIEGDWWDGWSGGDECGSMSNRDLIQTASSDDDSVWELLRRLVDEEVIAMAPH